ncbi:hypothetical protein NDU88_003494 [Pleurodeles waltl]|uniref:Uncharacterized protein n=1 Tax=Pleurodeles waltl TaxID=8319 RepID=A0AAV7KYN1_PLEWA|nr:hypothetical protein NDU88_003494 [Pleurodeles waltl]
METVPSWGAPDRSGMETAADEVRPLRVRLLPSLLWGLVRRFLGELLILVGPAGATPSDTYLLGFCGPPPAAWNSWPGQAGCWYWGGGLPGCGVGSWGATGGPGLIYGGLDLLELEIAVPGLRLCWGSFAAARILSGLECDAFVWGPLVG